MSWGVCYGKVEGRMCGPLPRQARPSSPQGERGSTSCLSKSCDSRQFCRTHSEAAINYEKREFIDYKTCMIKDEDPCGDCCSTSISVSHILMLVVKL